MFRAQHPQTKVTTDQLLSSTGNEVASTHKNTRNAFATDHLGADVNFARCRRRRRLRRGERNGDDDSRGYPWAGVVEEEAAGADEMEVTEGEGATKETADSEEERAEVAAGAEAEVMEEGLERVGEVPLPFRNVQRGMR